MADESEEFQRWAGPIRGDEVQEINLLVINAVINRCGDTPFKNFDPRKDGDWTTLDHAPDLRTNRLFPTVGLRQANELATLLERTAAGRTDLADLRLITLRLKGGRPAFHNLDQHLRELSEAASGAAEDMQRRTKANPSGLARPILTTIHIRVSDEDPERFDPHVHGLWHIAKQDIGTALAKLSGKRSKFGQVWIDSEPVRSVKRAGFYIAQGIIDYRGLHTWPDAAITAVWNMEQLRMFRKAGWFASESRTVAVLTAGKEEDITTETVQEAPVSLSRVNFGSDHTDVTSAPPEAVGGPNPAPTDPDAQEAKLFPFMRPYRQSTHLPKYTVRPATPEYIDLERYPTLGDIQATAIAIVEAEQRDLKRRADDVFADYGMSQEQVRVSTARTEAYFHLTLFHPGVAWIPTASGIEWATTVMAALDLLRQAAAMGRSELSNSYHDTQRLPDHLRRR